MVPTYWIVTCTFFLVAPVCIAEHVGIGAALSRCLFLTRGHRWQILVIILFLGAVGRAFDVAWVALVGSRGAIAFHPAGIVGFYSIWIVFGAFNAVMAAVCYDRLHSARDGAHVAEIFE